MKKGKKWSFWTKKNCFLAEFSLAEWGGTPAPPPKWTIIVLKKAKRKGGYPPHNGKNPLSSF